MNKLGNIKRKLYFKKFNLLFNKYLKMGKITEFDSNIYEKMDNTFISCLPVSFYIKYSKYLFPEGTCFERSLYMFLSLDNALLVRGKTKSLEYRYGSEGSGHGWIEVGNYVYDPSLMLKFDKDIYYSLYGCSDVSKINKETYVLGHSEFVNNYVSHNLNDFKPNGDRRLDLGLIVIQLKNLSMLLDDKEFIDDLNNYLNKVLYDDEQIYEERCKVMKKILTKKEYIANL